MRAMMTSSLLAKWWPEAFMTAVAPGSFARGMNRYFRTREEFIFAVAGGDERSMGQDEHLERDGPPAVQVCACEEEAALHQEQEHVEEAHQMPWRRHQWVEPEGEQMAQANRWPWYVRAKRTTSRASGAGRPKARPRRWFSINSTHTRSSTTEPWEAKIETSCAR